MQFFFLAYISSSDSGIDYLILKFMIISWMPLASEMLSVLSLHYLVNWRFTALSYL